MQCKKMQHEIVTYGKEETEITHQSEKQITDSLMKELYTLMSLSRVTVDSDWVLKIFWSI